MTGLKLAGILAFLCCTSVLAQQDNPYNGTWAARADGERSVDAEGTIVIKDTAGTWSFVARNRDDPCFGKESPLEVRKASADELMFVVMRSKVLAGCRDFRVMLKRVDEQTLEGKFGDGRRIAMKRK